MGENTHTQCASQTWHWLHRGFVLGDTCVCVGGKIVIKINESFESEPRGFRNHKEVLAGPHLESISSSFFSLPIGCILGFRDQSIIKDIKVLKVIEWVFEKKKKIQSVLSGLNIEVRFPELNHITGKWLFFLVQDFIQCSEDNLIYSRKLVTILWDGKQKLTKHVLRTKMFAMQVEITTTGPVGSVANKCPFHYSVQYRLRHYLRRLRINSENVFPQRRFPKYSIE